MPTFNVKTTPAQITAIAAAPTVDAAREIAALFPKSLRIRAHVWTRVDPATDELVDQGGVWMSVDTAPSRVTGEVNESGMRRYRSFLKHCKRLGFEIVSK